MTDLYNFFNPICEGEYDHESRTRYCQCGSGKGNYAVVDDKGIFDAYVCVDCETSKPE